MNINITNGVVKFKRNIKTGDYEGKDASIELTFSVPEGENAGEHIAYVAILAENHVNAALGLKETKGQAAAASNPTAGSPAKAETATASKPSKPAKGKTAPAKKAAEKDPAEIEDPLDGNGEASEGNTLDDLLGLNEAPPTEITDKALNDAVQKAQDTVKNAPAIRKLLNDHGVKTPGGRLIDLEQNKRQSFIDKLQLIKPLA